LLAKGPLKIAVDTKPILGRGAVEDTYNLLGQGIQQLIRALAKRERLPSEAWAESHALSGYFDSSLKGSADLDWSDPAARGAFLAQIVADARRLLYLSEEAVIGEEAPALQEAAELLRHLLLQDVVEPPPGEGGGPGKVLLRQGTVEGRIPSATDPQQRHGRKSESHRFTGYKGAIATDRASQIILDADVLDGSSADAAGLLEQVEQIERTSGERVAEVLGDCAYGSGETRKSFADAGRDLVAKVPQERTNGGRYPKSAFVLDLVQQTVTCPAGHTIGKFQKEKDGGQLFHFGARCRHCPLRERCTTAPRGRSVSVHPQEELLQAARAYQESAAGRAHLRERVVVEHRLARLGQLGMGQARYVGRAKTRCQLLLLSTIANLRRVWNWVQGTARNGSEPEREPVGAAA
jgi:transposase